MGNEKSYLEILLDNANMSQELFQKRWLDDSGDGWDAADSILGVAAVVQWILKATTELATRVLNAPEQTEPAMPEAAPAGGAIEELLKQARKAADDAYHNWGNSQLDDPAETAIRQLVASVDGLIKAVEGLSRERFTLTSPTPLEAGRVYVVSVPPSTPASFYEVLDRQLAAVRQLSGAQFMVVPSDIIVGPSHEDESVPLTE